MKGKKFYYGRGCDRCNNTGHKGRMGLYELLIINDDIRDLISQRRLDRRAAQRLPQAGHGRRCASPACARCTRA